MSLLDRVWLTAKAGGVPGFALGCLMCAGMWRSYRRMSDPPSRTGELAAMGVVLLFCTCVAGPLFAFVYGRVFFRLFPQQAFWIFGGTTVLALGVVMNTVAWAKKYNDFPVIFWMNLGGSAVLGLGIPLFHAWMFGG